MRRILWVWSLAVFAGLVLVEAAYYLGDFSPLRRIAAFYWIACSVAIAVSAWLWAFSTFLEPGFWRLPGRAWYLVAFFLPPALILLDGGGIRFSHIDAEGIQQLAAGTYLTRNDPSFGVYRMSYFTYLARQFVLMALPSTFLGPSIWASRIGTTMIFTGSYLFFLAAILAWLRRIRMPDPALFAAFCGTSIALGHYVLLNVRKFEQTSMPIAVTLFFIAALLLYATRPGPLSFLWVAWSFGFFPEVYTPAMGAWGLALVALLYLIVRHRRFALAPVALYGVLAVWIAYRVVNAEDKGTLGVKFRFGIERYTASDWVYRYAHGVRSVVGSDFTLLPAPLALGLFAAAYLAWRQRDLRFAAVCVWSVAVAFVSLTFVGSNLNFPSHDIHRAMIIIPPLVVSMVYLLWRHLSQSPNPEVITRVARFLAVVSMAYLVFTSVFTTVLVRNFFGLGTVDDYDEAFVKINQIVNDPAAPPIARIYLVPPLDIDLESGLQYFAPKADVVRSLPPKGEKKHGYWVFSYYKTNPDDRFLDEVVPSLHARPFLRMIPE